MIHPILSILPMTRIRLFIARILYFLVRLFLPSRHVVVRRRGITYDLDLSEGIDLSIYLLGSYQPHVVKNPFYQIPENAIIFDIGANMGCMALQFAREASNGHVYAFEPTDFAYMKLLSNMDLNPALKERITPVKNFASDRSMNPPRPFAMASWKTDRFTSKGHPVHGGIERKTSFASCVTLDDFCRENRIQDVDLIKIDTEGQELAVLKGARNILQTFRPVVVFETGQYQLEEHNVSFQDFKDIFDPLGYRLICLQRGMEIAPDNVASQIPVKSTVDILALPDQKEQP